MVHVISRKPGEIENDLKKLSIVMQIQALLALVLPKTRTKFEYDWSKAASVASKGYETPRLTNVCARWVPVDVVLEKNRDENEAYMEFLRADDARLEQTRYIQEIQIKRHKRSLADALAQAEEFRALLKSIQSHGIRRPVLLVDVAGYDLPYRFYRFDGHHRAICAKFLGIETVPAFIFKVTPPQVLPPGTTQR
jgi:hypothetical protein